MSPAPAIAGITSIAPKRAVMIDDLTKVGLDGAADSSTEHLADPSRPSRVRSRRRTKAKFGAAEGLARLCSPITCSTCRVSYLTVVGLSESDSPNGWVCAVCGDHLEVPGQA
jgi:hypothetical protein